MKKPSNDYIAGLVDGEGCFALSFRRDVRWERGKRTGVKPVYFYWKPQFVIVLRHDDQELLEMVKDALQCGQISNGNNNQARYQVSNLDDLKNKIIPFFEKNTLYGKKRKDFLLWCEAIDILYSYKLKRGSVNSKPGLGFYKIVWEAEDIAKLVMIHSKMSPFKSAVKSKNRNKWIEGASRIGRSLVR